MTGILIKILIIGVGVVMNMILGENILAEEQEIKEEQTEKVTNKKIIFKRFYYIGALIVKIPVLASLFIDYKNIIYESLFIWIEKSIEDRKNFGYRITPDDIINDTKEYLSGNDILEGREWNYKLVKALLWMLIKILFLIGG